MSTTKLLRWSGLTSIAAGVLFALATVLHSPGEDVPAIISAAWVPAHAIGWVANLLLLLGLIGLYSRQAEKTGWLGLLGFVLAFLVNQAPLVVPAADWRVEYAFFARAGFTEAALREAANHNALLIDLLQLDRDLLQAYAP